MGSIFPRRKRKRDAIDDYTTLQWSTVCTEVAKLRLH